MCYLTSSTQHDKTGKKLFYFHVTNYLQKWINTMCSIPTVGYYSALKIWEILTHAITWRKLEDNMLSDISQSP